MTAITYSRKAIMQLAWRRFREAEARRAATLATGGQCYGNPATLADYIKRAWNAAKDEAHHYRNGGTASDMGLVILIAAKPASTDAPRWIAQLAEFRMAA